MPASFSFTHYPIWPGCPSKYSLDHAAAAHRRRKSVGPGDEINWIRKDDGSGVGEPVNHLCNLATSGLPVLWDKKQWDSFSWVFRLGSAYPQRFTETFNGSERTTVSQGRDPPLSQASFPETDLWSNQPSQLSIPHCTTAHLFPKSCPGWVYKISRTPNNRKHQNTGFREVVFNE